MTERRRPGPEHSLTLLEHVLRDQVPSREALLAEAKSQTVRQRRRKQVLGAGLSVMGLVALLWAFDPAWHSDDVQTVYGEHEHVQLADGSLIALNSATHLRIEHRMRSRQFELLDGEATFTVAPGDTPFIVHAQGVAVRGIGTVFNVRSDSRGVAVGVVDGTVGVSTAQAAPRRLAEGQQLLVEAGRSGPVTAFEAGRSIAWQQGKLRFDDTPLRDVLADIRRYRQAPVRLSEPRLGELRMSGEFDSAAVESLIDALPVILPVTLSRNDDGSVIVDAR
ncbi:iron dicitrate transport regulator FecR [Pseudomonas entomophila]|uniref:FecR family protein n=1 Tax=Pseudomonas entomophila TaxID=312306 RepID=UPI0015E43EF9|nr:FecR domain-containing protein [Pseudomonas entomophila]MBA1187981.1 iron dicitrate transport regulator FecR [Pseudomonas entomophila]